MTLPHLEVQEWVMSWISPDGGQVGHSMFVSNATSYFPVTRKFWTEMSAVVSENNNGAILIAITPIRYEPGHVADWTEYDEKHDLDAYMEAKEKKLAEDSVVPEPFLKLVT